MSSSEEEKKEDENEISVNKMCGNCNKSASILFGTVLLTNRDEDTKAVFPQHMPISNAISELFHLKSKDESEIELCQECSEVMTILINSQREFLQLQDQGSVVRKLINDNNISPIDPSTSVKSTTPKGGRGEKRKRNPPPPLVKEEREIDGNSDEDFRNDHSERDEDQSETDKSGDSDDQYEPRAPTRTSSRRNTRSHKKSSPAVEPRGSRKSAVKARANLKKINKGSGSESEESEHNTRPNTRKSENLKEKIIKTEIKSEQKDISETEEANDGEDALKDSSDKIIGVSDGSKPWPFVKMEILDTEVTSPAAPIKYKPGPLSSKKRVVDNEKPKSPPASQKESSNRNPSRAVKGKSKYNSDSGSESDTRDKKSKPNVTSNECPDCKKTYYDRSTLRKHYMRVHNGDVSQLGVQARRQRYPNFGSKNTCPECKKSFSSSRTARRHYAKNHDATVYKPIKGKSGKGKKKLKSKPVTSSESESEPEFIGHEMVDKDDEESN